MQHFSWKRHITESPETPGVTLKSVKTVAWRCGCNPSPPASPSYLKVIFKNLWIGVSSLSGRAPPALSMDRIEFPALQRARTVGAHVDARCLLIYCPTWLQLPFPLFFFISIQRGFLFLIFLAFSELHASLCSSFPSWILTHSVPCHSTFLVRHWQVVSFLEPEVCACLADVP